MDIVAQVFNLSITRTELDFSEMHLLSRYPDVEEQTIHKHALSRLIDDYLLMHEAMEKGIVLEEEEFDNAMLEFLEIDIDLPEASLLVNRLDRGEQIERIVRTRLINTKYIRSLCDVDISEEDVYQYYLVSRALFTKDEEVRASHILIRGEDSVARQEAYEIYSQIHNHNEFIKYCSTCSVCPSSSNCGDLGFFRRGIMMPEFDEIAFKLQINEISQPFKSCYGYHILMVTDKKPGLTIEFDDIKTSLRETLIDLRMTLTVQRLFKDIKQRYADAIKIF